MADLFVSNASKDADNPPNIGPVAGTIAGFAIAALGGLLIEIGALQGLKSGEVLRDVATSFDLPVLAGSVTFLSVICLTITATLALFAAGQVRDGRGLLLWLGVVSGVLALDDQMMLHERVLPMATGLPEELFLAIYAFGGLAIVIALVKGFGLRALAGLAPALVFISLSVLADLEVFGESSYAMEDLLKVAGFGAWAVFWWSFCAGLTKKSPRA